MSALQEALRISFSYDPEEGLFRWKTPTSPRTAPGSVAGKLTAAGRFICWKSATHSEAKLAVLYMTGSLPDGHVWRTDLLRSKFNDLIYKVAGQRYRGYTKLVLQGAGTELRRLTHRDASVGFLGGRLALQNNPTVAGA